MPSPFSKISQKSFVFAIVAGCNKKKRHIAFRDHWTEREKNKIKLNSDKNLKLK